MSLNTLILILSSVSLSAVAQILFKFGVESVKRTQNQTGVVNLAWALISPGVIGGLVLYGVGTILWLGVLSRVDVSQAYPFVGVGFVLTAILGAWIFGDVLTAQRCIGMLIVVVGIYFVSRS
jgi:drug/metabolite transporter (DMT)-like permease